MQFLQSFVYFPIRFLRINHNHYQNQTSIAKHLLYYDITCFRHMSQSTSIPKKQQRVRDHGYDNYMEVYKKIRKVLKFQDLILSQPNHTICMSRLDILARRFDFKQYEAGAFILKFPHVFEIYEHPVQRILYCRLTRKATLQIEQENQALQAQIPDATIRLRKLLMLSKTGRLRLEHIRIARLDFGLPEDFEFSVILKNPQFFRLFDAEETRSKYVEVVNRDPSLAVCAIGKLREKEYRERGIDAENIRFSFIVNFPPGFKIGKYYKIAVWKWQRLPYWSPYEDVSGHDLRSLEAQKRMEKRAIATIHELLSLTVEKKLTLERIAHFRLAMDMPKKLKEFLLQHQGIFYISTRGNHGKLHTVFLREAYQKGELIEPNELYLARRKLAELILLSPRKAAVDLDLFESGRDREDNGRREIGRDGVQNSHVGFMFEHKLGMDGGQEEDSSLETGTLGIDGEKEEDLGSETGGDSDFTGEESDLVETSDEDDVHC
ncbi:protein ROOT PRIMORDIUM DEFECTIVE 1 [Macadamia integrifolia]|uniref:protein ROOT PRIMORDIUM DEFECTIVE 1 n=1 Tax=Macadamia integrifolia TaxID=60698 RepID=UPI001C4F2C6A|nr:protein ROOT PRIMORDIUM DEFECTIVE 1 [Macadamia integrifolia]XP_042512461.1 protein ROOT PRIMORDIUM DEFECTIVE 1 [Macadamia integrifolia]XP_042512462.1 protein ROOT PRIMORDIUM DEFECTIVE 1 [Macadamia integrifolia]XP_042512463.1 protein ROOT PRIMORDIUM DEFECTIVE 1 [Macadamia integrifolia]XP_042512464.1 protein ROOT PRIMORDIUM DEFECTIVE 1 [Macadamia integrifolia]